MARARNLKPQFFTDAELLECPFWVRLLFQGLWIHADCRGILLDSVKQIKIDVFPADDVDIEAGLTELAARGFIVRYDAAGQRLIQFLQPQRFFSIDREITPQRAEWQRIRKSATARVVARDGRRCRYCGDRSGPFHRDHVIPLSRGGSNDDANLVLSCRTCNLRKGSRPVEGLA